MSAQLVAAIGAALLIPVGIACICLSWRYGRSPNADLGAHSAAPVEPIIVPGPPQENLFTPHRPAQEPITPVLPLPTVSPLFVPLDLTTDKG